MEGIRRVFSYYGDNEEGLLDRMQVFTGDLLELEKLEEAMQGVTEVFHCAAVVSFDPREKQKVIQMNVEATANVVNTCLALGARKLVHVSSTAALGGSVDGAPVTEAFEWKYSRATSGYYISKYESEREVWRGEAEGLQVVVVNPSMIIGPGNWGESSTSLISKCWEGLPFYTEGVNAYVDVRDVAAIMVYLMESDISGERYILASENITFRSLFEKISTALGKPAPRFRVRRWMGELFWRVEWLRSRANGKPSLVTRETTRTAMSVHRYSSQKIRSLPGVRFRPLDETITWTCKLFLDDHQG
jgi:nucleoside-diphosphate-sugar epimerase